MLFKRELFILFLLVGFSFVSVNTIEAQHKTLKIEDAFNPSVYPASLRQLQWAGDENVYAYVKDNQLIIGQVGRKNDETESLNLETLNSFLEKQGAEEMRRLPALKLKSSNSFTFIHENTLWEYTIEPGGLKIIARFHEDAQNTEFAPQTNTPAYTKGNNLYININGEEIAVTSDEDEGIVNGQTVHRSEFGIKDGIFWSPKGDLLAFYRKDERMVTNYPLVNTTKRIAEVENTRYPMAGMTSEEVSVGIYNVSSGETVFLKTANPTDRYFTNISWSPDQKHIYMFELNREQNHCELICYEVKTGEKLKTLFEEKSERYVEPLNGLLFLNNNHSNFICQSQRDGWNHIYLYNTDGRLIKQLTSGEWIVKKVLGISSDDKLVYFTATKDSPLETNLYSVDISKAKISRLTRNKGTHSVQISNDGEYILDAYSSLEVASEVHLLRSSGRSLQTLLENDDPLSLHKTPTMKVFTIKSADESTDLYCRMILPPDFDGSRKYPVLVYVYGGPHAQLITDSWLGGAGIYLNYMASQDYVVFTLDNRGSANRGFEFESCIHRNLGVIEVEDQMAGVAYLKSLSFVDTTRMAVEGWSYGGFMAISLMVKHPGVFAAASAGGPVTDWQYYEVMYGERYMGTPENNPKGYKNANLMDYADKLDGKLLIIHGTMDPVVVWQHSIQFLKACIEAGKQIDYFVYPGHEHNIRGRDRLHMWKKIAAFFDDNLKK